MTLVWLQDLRLNAELSGPPTAPPLVLIHGQGLDLHLWDALMPWLAAHRVLRCDLRGHGASDAPPAPYALGTLIRDVERLIDHFALKDTVILGHGEGGLIAQGLAVKRLDLVRALVLTGTAPRLPPRSRPAVPAAHLPLLLGPRWRDQPQAGQRGEINADRRSACRCCAAPIRAPTSRCATQPGVPRRSDRGPR